MAWKQLRDMLEDILASARARQQEYDRRGEGGGGEEVDDSWIKGSWYAGKDTADARVGG